MTMDLIPKRSGATGCSSMITRAWCGIWRYCETVAPEITSKVKHGYSNSGDGLNADDAFLLGEKVKASIADGSARRWFDEQQAKRLEWGVWYQFETLGAVAEFFCTSGGFEIW